MWFTLRVYQVASWWDATKGSALKWVGYDLGDVIRASCDLKMEITAVTTWKQMTCGLSNYLDMVL
jgi:hypothetical protein